MTASREPSRKKPKEAQQEEVSRTPDTHLHPTARCALLLLAVVRTGDINRETCESAAGGGCEMELFF